MTVRLLARHSLLVGLVASLTSLGGFGCADDKSKSDLDDSGPPKILQVFVLDPANSDDPLQSGYALTYGIHADAWKCGVVDDDCGEDPNTGDALICFNAAAGAATTDPLFGHCVDAASHKTPTATSAQVAGASIRIVSKELYDGKKLEQFACACHGNCPAGGEWSIDPNNCSACGEDDSTTIGEAGRCLDLNNDRIPDLSTLQGGVATITCAGVPSFGTGGVYLTQQGDGYYYPSGNGFPPSATGYLGLGPALVIEPQINLPTSTSCTIAVSDTVTDKDGNPFVPTDGSVEFQTEALAIAGSTPEADDDMAEVTDTVEIDFNASIDPDSVSELSTGVRVAGTSVFLPLAAEDGLVVEGGAIVLTLAAELLPGTDYEIVVDGAVTDEYQQPFGADETITFSTAAM